MRRWPGVALGSIVRPEVMLVVPVLLSALAWSVPGSSLPLRGFAERTPVTPGGLAVLTAWYGACVLLVYLGVRLGRRLFPNGPHLSSPVIDSRASVITYRVLTVLALVGIAAALIEAQAAGAIAAAITHATGNSLNAAIGHQAGIATLRYTPAVSAPFGVWLAMRRRASWVEATLNLMLLGATALFSSRLSLLLATVVFIALAARSWPRLRVNVLAVLAAGVAGYGVLTALNYFRNSHYYAANGVHDPFLMNWYQVLSYLAAPFQVATAWANAAASGQLGNHEDLQRAASVLLPTFIAPGQPDPIYLGPRHIDISSALTTNSVFADTLERYGWFGLAFAALAYLLLAVVFGAAERMGLSTALIAGVVLYAYAEVWRIFLVRQGIFVFLLLVAVLACVLGAVIARHGRRAAELLSWGRRAQRGQDEPEDATNATRARQEVSLTSAR